MNTVTIYGNLGGVPELTETKSGLAVAEFTVCSTHGKDEKRTDTWFNVKCFGDMAKHLCNTVNKGDKVIIVGRMETKEYTKKDGSKSKFTSLIADEIGVSLRWNTWLKDRSEQTVNKVGKVGRPMPAPLPTEEPF